MVKILPRYLGLAAAVALIACSDDGPTNSDPGPTDSGFVSVADLGVTEADAGQVDVDAGVGPCDPVTGSGCPGTDRCVYVPPPNDFAQCRDIGSANAVGTACDPLLSNCEAGATCLLLDQAEGPLCRKTCNPTRNDADCASLPGSAICQTLIGSSGEYGFCQAFTVCSPLNDTCPVGEVCSIIGQGQVGCLPAGPVRIGQTCGNQNCIRGAVCLNAGDGPQCYEPCDFNAANPMCNTPNTRCGGLQDFDFGICVPQGVACNPLDDMCPQSERCTLVGAGAAECRTAGNTPRGGDCSMISCQRGNVCVNANGTGATCYQPCGAGVNCTLGSCSNNLTGFDFGICL